PEELQRPVDRMVRRGELGRPETHGAARALAEPVRLRRARPARRHCAPVLRGLRQPDAVAALPSIPAERRVRPRGLEGMRGGKPDLPRRGAARAEPGRPGLDPRLSLDAVAAAVARCPALVPDRLLPPYPVPRLRCIPHAPAPGGAAAGPAGRRP